MPLALSSPPNWGPVTWQSKKDVAVKQLNSVSVSFSQSRRCFKVKACPFNPSDEPILNEALKEPVAFMGGIFAGLLRLDLNEDPLKEWLTRTMEGLSDEEIESGGAKLEEESPLQIEIE